MFQLSQETHMSLSIPAQTFSSFGDRTHPRHAELGTVRIIAGKVGVLPRTLDVSLVLNAGTVHQGTPLPDFPIFTPLHTLFWHFSF
jgi:hypothetical protein